MVSGDELVFDVKSQSPTLEPTMTHKKRSMSMDEITFTRKKRTLSPEKYKELEEIYSKTIVHDYGDEYHLSEEEKKKKFKYYEVFAKLKRCKRKFRKLDDFIKVYRLCMDCLDVVANDNGVYSPEKFKEKVIKGDIEVFGLNFPKYIGKDKKDINWSYVTEYVIDKNKDPKDFSKDKETVFDNMDEDDLEKILFTEEELKHMEEVCLSEDSMIISVDEDKDSSYDEFRMVSMSSKKKTNELIETFPEILKLIKETEKDKRRSRVQKGHLNSFVFGLTEDDFDEIEEIDKSRGFNYETDMPVFKGDISNKKDYKKYLLALRDYELNNIKYNYNGKMLTASQIEEIKLKDMLERSGWNIRAVYRNKEKEKKLKRAEKRDKQRTEELKKKLLEINKRSEKRKESQIEFNSKKKKKKKKKNDESP